MSYCKYFIGKFNEAVSPWNCCKNGSSIDHTGKGMKPLLSILDFLLKCFCWTAFSKWAIQADYKNEQLLACVYEYVCLTTEMILHSLPFISIFHYLFDHIVSSANKLLCNNLVCCCLLIKRQVTFFFCFAAGTLFQNMMHKQQKLNQVSGTHIAKTIILNVFK